MSVCQRCGREYRPLRRGYCHRCDMRRRSMVGYQSSYVDAEPVRQHVKALLAAGVGARRVCVLAGVSRSILQSLMRGKTRDGRREPPSHRVSRRTAERILAVPIPDVPHGLVAGGARVPAVGTVRRLQALVAFGYTRTYLGQRIGWSVANMPRLLDPATEQVNADTARKVAELFAELQMAPGPSVRARNDGRRRGWAPPFAWDEDKIDDPNAEPDLGRPERLSFPERYAEMRDLGLGDEQIASRLGITPASLERQLWRHGLRQAAS